MTASYLPIFIELVRRPQCCEVSIAVLDLLLVGHVVHLRNLTPRLTCQHIRDQDVQWFAISDPAGHGVWVIELAHASYVGALMPAGDDLTVESGADSPVVIAANQR